VIALAGNLYFLGSRVLTGLAAVLVAHRRGAQAGQMRALHLLIRRHRKFSFLRIMPFLVWQSMSGGRYLANCISQPVSGELSSLYHPADQCACGDAYCKRRCNRQQRVSLKALSRIIPEFFGYIAALLGGALHYPHAIFDRIANCIRCA
jgi:hypothetical protein